MKDITKAIIPIAGLGTRFLPLSKVLPKELWPLVDKPLIQYALEELKEAGVSEFIFVVNSARRPINEYFKRQPKLERFLQVRKKENILEELKRVETVVEGLTFSYVTQREQAGDGHAVLQAKRHVGDNPAFVVYPDDVIEAKVSASVQLAQVFRTAEKPITGLFRMPAHRLPSYGVVSYERIARRLVKVKDIVEKPEEGAAPSDLAIVGRRVITPEVFSYLKKAQPNKRGEITLTEALGDMVKDGKLVYGYEIAGTWLECGDKLGWLKSQAYYTLKHSVYGKEVRSFLREQNLL